MTPRERNMLIGLLTAILIGGGAFCGYTFVFTPLEEANASIQQLRDEIDGSSDKQGLFTRVTTMRKSAAEAALVKRQSLPLNVDLAKNQYKLLLDRLLQQVRIENYQNPNATPLDNRPPLTPDLGNNKKAFTRLGFKLKLFKVDIWQLTDFLYEFYELDLLHQITDLKITRENKPNEVRSGLDVDLTIEAIILDSAEPKPALFPVSLAGNITSAGEAVAAIGGGRAMQAVAIHPELSRKVTALTNAPVLATRSRDYSLLAQKDIFYGILPDKPPPGLQFAKIPDIQINMEEKKIPDVKVSLVGDGSDNARISATASGSMIPEGPLEIDPTTNTISFPPVKDGLTGWAYATVTVNAVSDSGREGKTKFEVKFNRPPPSPPLDDIAAEIRLSMVNGASDGSMMALILDNATPLKYKIVFDPKNGISVQKTRLDRMRPRDRPDPSNPDWKVTSENKDGVLAISDDVSSTKKNLKVIAIEQNSLIVTDLGKPDAKADANKGGKGNRPGGGVPAVATVQKSGHSNPMTALAGNLALAEPTAQAARIADLALRVVIGNLAKSPTPPVLYRWGIGKSLKDLDQAKIPPEEARKILQNVAENGGLETPVSVAK